jgi:hypothetical protein
VVGLESLQVVSLLGIVPLVLNTRMGGVVALRWRGGTVHGLPSMVLVLLQLERDGSLMVVTMVVFVVVAFVGKMFWIVLTLLLSKGWFSSLVPVVTKRYITFGDNGRGRVLSEGEIKVSDKITLRRVAFVQSLGYNLLLCPSYWMRVLRCCFGLVVLRFGNFEGTLSVWSFLRVRCFELIFLSLLVLSIVSWLALRVSCGSGIGSWVT